MPTSSTRPIAGKAWGKRLVFLGTAIAILLGIFGATTHKPVLLRSPEQIESTFDSTILEAAHKIDREFRADWDQQGLRPAPPAPWHTVARRISLGMVGNGLSLEEYRSLEKIPEDQRVSWWTEYLLKDRRWADQFA